MTDQKHTKEPWMELYTDHSTFVGVDEFDICNMIDGDKEANANRIVACVNALAGIDDPEAFMRVAREYVNGGRNIDIAESELLFRQLQKHLKGGAE